MQSEASSPRVGGFVPSYEHLIALPGDKGVGTCFLTYGTGRGVHMPFDCLPSGNSHDDEDPRGATVGTTFITAVAASAAKAKITKRRSTVKERRMTQVALAVTGKSVEDDIAAHPDWNNDFQSAADAESVEMAINAFEREVDITVRRLAAATAHQSAPRDASPGGAHDGELTAGGPSASAPPLAPMPGMPGRYLHRGIYYLDCRADGDLLRFFGSAEAADKAVEAEFRAMKYLWSLETSKATMSGVRIPLATVFTYLGRKYFACAMPPITQRTLMAGPLGAMQYHAVTNYTCRQSLQRLSDNLHMRSIYVSKDHATKREEYPIFGSVEMSCHLGRDGRVYVLEVARLMPPTDPRPHNALFLYSSEHKSGSVDGGESDEVRSASSHISSRTSSHGSLALYSQQTGGRGKTKGILALLGTASDPNRYSTANKNGICYHVTRPEGLEMLTKERTLVPSIDGKGAPVTSTFANTIDGVTSVAFTPLSDIRGDDLMAQASARIVERATAELLIQQVSFPATKKDSGLSGAEAIRLLQHNGLNARYLGEVLRRVQAIADALDQCLKTTSANNTLIETLQNTGINPTYLAEVIRLLQVIVDVPQELLPGRATTDIDMTSLVSAPHAASAPTGAGRRVGVPPLNVSVMMAAAANGAAGPSTGMASSRYPASARSNNQQVRQPLPPGGPRTARGRPDSGPPAADASELQPKCIRGVALPLPTVHNRLTQLIGALRVEAVCRCFKIVCREQWNACFAAGAEAAVASPPRKDIFDRAVEDSVMMAAERSFVRSKSLKHGGVKSTSDRLLYQLKALGEDLELGEDALEVKFKRGTAIQQNRLWKVDAAVTSLVPYCMDDTERLRPDIQSSRTVEGRVRAKTAHMLSLLAVASPASERFWDTVLCTEVWTKYGRLGRPQDMRSLPKAELIQRACELLGITLNKQGLEASQRYGAFQDQHVEALTAIVKRYVVPSDGSDEAGGSQASAMQWCLRMTTPAAPLQRVPFDTLQQKVDDMLFSIGAIGAAAGDDTTKNTIDARSQTLKDSARGDLDRAVLLSHLRELEQRLLVRGAEKHSDLVLTRLTVSCVTRAAWEESISKLWEHNGLDGIVYVPCAMCIDLIDASNKRHHVCRRTTVDDGDGSSPQRATINAPQVSKRPVPLGLGDGSLPSRLLSCSTARPGCDARYARLGADTLQGWEPLPTDKFPWLQVQFPRRCTVTSLKMRGSTASAFIRAFRIEYTVDEGATWKRFKGDYTHENAALACEPQYFTAAQRRRSQTSFLPLTSGDTVVRLPKDGLFGNTDGASVVTIVFASPFEATSLRIIPGADGRTSDEFGLRLELFTATTLVDPPARNTPGTVVVPLSIVDFASVIPASNGGAGLTRRQYSDEEHSLIKKINTIESDVFEASEWVEVLDGTAKAERHSKELSSLYLRWIELLEAWGPERAGDVAVVAARFSAYRVAEAELSSAQGCAIPIALVPDLTPLLFCTNRESVVLEAVLRRLVALFAPPPTSPDEAPPAPPVVLVTLLKRLLRWVGKGSRLLPFLAPLLRTLCPPRVFLDLAKMVADRGRARLYSPLADRLEAEGVASDLSDTFEQRAALLVVCQRALVKAVEASDRVMM